MLSILLICITISILLSLSIVQTTLGKMATDYLNKDFNVSIDIKKIDLSYVGTIHLKEVLIKDHHADTLIYINKLSSSILSYKKIIDNKLEFGTISLNNFKLHIRTYNGESDDALTIFIDKFDDGKTSNKPSTFLFTAGKLNLEKGYVDVFDENIENENLIFFKNIKGTAKKFKIKGPDVSALIYNLGFTENHNVDVTGLTSDFMYTKTQIHFLNTILETATSKIETDVVFNYNREDLVDFNNKVNIDATVKNADVSLEDLKKFYNEFGSDEKIHFTAKITGTLNDLTFNKLNLISDNNAKIIGDIALKNSFNKQEDFSIDAKFKNLTSDYQQLKLLLPNILGKSLPSSFIKLGEFTLIGTTYITQDLISASVNINSDLGSAFADIELTNVSKIDDASYVGHIKVNDFELGKFLNNPLIGKIAVEADVDGEGFTLEKMNTSIKGLLSKYEYNKYTFKNINMNGVLKSKHFNGELGIDDPNLKMKFNGLADFSKDVYTFNFKTNVTYCDLKAINIFTRDSISQIKGDVAIDFKGNSLDDLTGAINFKNALYTNPKGAYYFKDFNITSSFSDSTHTIDINSSEILSGYLKGRFKFAEFWKLAQNSIGSIYSNYKPKSVTPGQYLDFRFKIYNQIVEIFYPQVNLGANTTIRGTINSDDNLFSLNIKSPHIEAFGNIIDDVNLQINNKNPLFNTHLTIDKIHTKYYDFADMQLVNVTLNDTLFFRTEFKGGINKDEEYNIAFYHTYNKENKSVFGIQKSTFNFKKTDWVINAENNLKNNVVYDAKTNSYNINPISITSENQKIQIFGKLNDSISKDLKFSFENVKLYSVTPDIDSLKLNGIINGTLSYQEEKKIVKPTANLVISNFAINNLKQGDLKIAIEGKNSVTNYGVAVSVKKDNSVNFLALGDIDFSTPKPTINGTLELEKYQLDAFSPLGEDVLSNIRGNIYGEVKFTGLLENPDMDGDLFLDNAGIYIPYLNIDYAFDGTSIISLHKQTFSFEDVTLKDTYFGTKGKLTGTISQSSFDNWKLNLNINTPNLAILNTKEEEASLYYGTGFLAGNATIIGPTDKLVIDVVGKSKKGTNFVIPISDVKTVENSELIRFVGKNQTIINEASRKAFYSEQLKGLSLNFNLEVTKDAVIEMVLDKATRSYLKGSGTGHLQIEIDTKGTFNMYGDFLVDNGIYDFKYGGFINKQFIVRKGGTISWSGDPYKANINIEAVYRLSANPKSLLENLNTNRKIPIDLVTRFSGELFNSQRGFDIEIPNSSSTVASELEFKLKNNDKNLVTRNFISLLVSGAFYNESNLSVNSSGLVYGTGSDLLSNAFDNIFNQGSNKFKLKPIYTVGEKNKIENLNINDQLALALDYQINDRVIINGKVGVPIGSSQQSNVIGEVNIEFLMNEDGSLRSTVFNRQNEIQYTNQEEGYTQGVGLSYQIDFDKGKELLQKLSLRKLKQKKDSISEIKIGDTTVINKKLIEFKNRKNIKNE